MSTDVRKLSGLFLVLIVVSIGVKILLDYSPASAAVNYDRNAAMTWIAQNWNKSELGSGYCTGAVAGTLAAGGISGMSSQWTGNNQLVKWMKSNLDKWKFVSSPAELEPGDFILYSYHPEALSDWSKIWPTGNSWWDHSAVYLGDNKVAAWNSENYNINYAAYDINKCCSPPRYMKNRKYIHILDTDESSTVIDKGYISGATDYNHSAGAGLSYSYTIDIPANTWYKVDIQPHSGSKLNYELQLSKLSGEILVTTRTSAEGRGILYGKGLSAGQYRFTMIPLSDDANGSYTIAYYHTTKPRFDFAWDTVAYSDIINWYGKCDSKCDTAYLSIERTAGKVEFNYVLYDTPGNKLSSGKTANGKANIPFSTSQSEVNLDLTPIDGTGKGSFKLRMFTGAAPVIYTELLQNGTFEESDEYWVQKGINDKIRCNKDKDGDGDPEKVYDFEGLCVFQFKGDTTKGKLTQNISSTAVSGQTLVMTGWINAKNYTGGASLRTIVVYADGSRDVLKLTPEPGTYDYTAITGSLDLQNSIDHLKIQLGMKSNSEGIVFMDSISLVNESSQGVLIPLPVIKGN